MSAPGSAANFAKSLKTGKPFQPVVATANDLATGVVVFRTRAGHWTGSIDDAEIAADAEAATRLQNAAEQDRSNNFIVDLALIPVVLDGGAVKPVALRERIRAQGPTIAVPSLGVA